MRAALTLLLLSAAAPVAPAADRLQLDVAPAWHGWSRPDRSTELEVRLSGVGETTIVVTAGPRRIETAAALEADRPARIRLPVPSVPTITVHAAGATGVTTDAVVALSMAESPLLAWVSPAAPPAEAPAGFRQVAFDSSALPAHGSAYASIDALVIDAAVLASLQDHQLTALLDYVARCGRGVLVGGSQDAQQLLAAAAGCGGRALGFAASTSEVPWVLRSALQQELRPSVSTTAVATLGGPDLEHWHLVVGVLAASAALLLLASVLRPALVLHLTLAALAALVAVWFVQSRPAATRLTVWAEAGPGERVAQYRALHLVTLGRRSQTVVDALPQLAVPVPCRDTPGATWRWSVEERRFAGVDVPARLFARVATCYAGHFPVARIAERLDGGHGTVVLHNPGPARWSAGAVTWRGELHELPVIEPGQRWIGSEMAAVAPRTPAERLALARTTPGSAAVLWPLDLALLKTAPQASQAWLMVAALEPPPADAP